MPADELADFGHLVETHYRAVVAVAYATTRDVALAEDIAQDTFIAAWDAREKLRDREKVRPWLCSIARNKSRNALRSRKREVAEEADVADPKPSVVDGAVEREATAELHAALAEVPMTYREPLVLFYWEQKSIAQVASALAITEEAAQKRISRGRSFLRDGLEAPLEGASRGRRTAAAAAAAVLAILATRTAAQAAAAKKGSTTMLKAFGFVGVAGLVVGTVAVVRNGASDAASQEVAPPTPVEKVSSSKVPPRAPSLTAGAAKDVRPTGMPAAGYEVTVLSPTAVAVALAGGKAATSSRESPPAPQFERRITGRVLDDAGKPVAGAAVVVGTRLSALMGSVTGAGGAMTGADGRFTATMHEDTAGYAFAMHTRGWSKVASYPAGAADAEVALTTPAPGTLAIHVRQAGVPQEAQVMFGTADGSVTLYLVTDAHGELVVPLLPPGAYRLQTWQGRTVYGPGGTSPATVTDITVVGGRATDVPVEIPPGALVSVSAFKPGMFSVEYFLYPGSEKLELAEMKKRARAGVGVEYLLGGVDAERTAELHDILPGAYTLCVDAVAEDYTHHPLVCRPLTVPTDKSILDVTVDVQ